jgi:glyoxylase-like metal-dependent hydrolase (beta-lactamase superfamily II)
MKMHVIDNGSMHCDLTWLVLQGGFTLATRSEPALPRQWVECPTYTVLIEHPDALILWDTSVPSDWETRWAIAGSQEFFPYDAATADQRFPNALEKRGYDFAAIDILVQSHLHADHTGHLREIADAGARVICSQDEYDGAMGFDGPVQGVHIKSDYEGIAFETIAGDEEIVPGVRLVQAPGHSWGTCALQVDLPRSGTILVTSDAVYRAESWGPPAVGSAIAWSSRAWESSVEKLRKLASRTDARVIFGHDALQMAEMRQRGTWTYE